MSEKFTIAMLILSFLILMGTIAGVAVLSKKRRKTALENSSKNIAIKPFQLFVLGFYAAAFFILLPHWVGKNIEMGIEDVVARIYSSIWLTFHMVFRLSALNEEFANTIAQVISNPTVNSIYYCYSATIFVAAPLMAMSVILSFIKGVRSLFRYYVVNAGKNIVVFSELNEQSLVLAKDILRHDKDDDKKSRRSVVVFTGVTKKIDSVLLESAENLGAVCFRKDITLIRLKAHNKKLTRKLYFISENEEKNLNKGLTVLKTCLETPALDQDATKIFIFSTAAETSILLDNVPTEGHNVFFRRVDVSRNLAYDFMWKRNIFEGARVADPKGEKPKEINVAIVGFGAYGREMLKAFCWMGQMPGYEVNAVVFDKDKDTESKMKALAPFFVNGFVSDSQELNVPHYTVSFACGDDVKTYDFLQKVKEKNDEKPFTHVIVSLGDDRLNVRTAIQLRSFLCREKIKKDVAERDPEKDVVVNTENHLAKIYAVVFDDEQYAVVNNGLKGIADEKKKVWIDKSGVKNVEEGQTDYEITFIGNLSAVYSVENVEQLVFERLAWEKHQAYGGGRKEFNQNEYNRLSSGASRMFEAYRDGTDGKEAVWTSEGTDEKRKKEEQNRIEHRRWWVYMAAEGFEYVNAELRDDVAKVHYDMVEYDLLTEEEKKKDDPAAKKKPE